MGAFVSETGPPKGISGISTDSDEGLPPILMPARNYIAASLQASEGVRETKIWGGFITENACQAIARDIFGDILLRLEKAGISVVLHSHDEVLVEVPLEVTKRKSNGR